MPPHSLRAPRNARRAATQPPRPRFPSRLSLACLQILPLASLLVLTIAIPARATPQTTPPVAPPPAQAPAQSPAQSQPKPPTPAASLPAEPAPTPFLISGVVIDTVTRSPVPNAVLTIEPMTTVRRAGPGGNRRPRRRFPAQGQTAAATSDATGHFELEAPNAGGWALTAAARGYTTQALDEHEGYSTAVILTDAAPKADITFRLTPASTIEGYILDEAGEPVRSAQVALSYIAPPTPDNEHPRPQVRSQQTTDDRGFYKFAGNGPGSYQIRVSAHPWYATSAPGQAPSLNGPDTQNGTAAPDPLDVVYPTVWYPGVIDPGAASAIVLRGGDTQEANLRLLPIPGFHLRVHAPAGQEDLSSANGGEGSRGPRAPSMMTYATRIMPDGTEEAATSFAAVDEHGNTDLAGLVPGNYLVHQQSPTSQAATLSTLQIGPNSARTVDFTSAVPATTVTVQFDPQVDTDSIQIIFRDTETGHLSFALRSLDPGQYPGQIAGQRNLRRRAQSDAPAPGTPAAPHPDRTIDLPPGKYEITLSGQGDLHLSSIEAAGATVAGRTVTIDGGSPKLVLHTANGRGVVSGFVTSHGHPDAGSMVLLIPATFGDPSGIDLPARDQSNSDGSFEMSGILPGGYILVAIDHGWDVNWSDPATLRRYLVHGMALDIKPGTDLKEHIEALAP